MRRMPRRGIQWVVINMSIGRLLIFLAVVLSITAGIHYFLWIRLARDPAWPAPVVRGYLVSAENTNFVLSVTSVTDRYGQEQSWRGERVRVPRLAIQDFQQRRFSLGRTLLLGAALLGGSVAAWDIFKGGLRGGSVPGPGGGGVVK